MTTINLYNISKKFNDDFILKSVSLCLNSASFSIFQGDNGSGKSTLFKIICGLLSPDEGSVYFDQQDISKNYLQIQKKIGVILSEDRSLYHKLTAYENLYYIGRIYGIPKSTLKENIPVLLDKVGLDNNKKLVENFSTGMKKKLMIARAIIHDPDVIIADELLNGLD